MQSCNSLMHFFFPLLPFFFLPLIHLFSVSGNSAKHMHTHTHTHFIALHKTKKKKKMSLECEGDGAPCVECGEFDFLPHTCPFCHGVFCAAHASCHHVPGAQDTDNSAVLCTPPPPLAGPAPTEGVDSSRASTTLQVRCVVCRAFPCAITSCPQCGESFCAVHRFHGHEDAALQERLRRRGAGPARAQAPSFFTESLSPSSSSSSSATATGDLRALCAPFTISHPLTLAPVGYRSRRMDLLALVVRYAPSPSPLSVIPPPAGSATPLSAATVVEDTISSRVSSDVGLCSLIVATEMSVGQLRDRLEAALVTAQEEAAITSSSPRAFSLASASSVFSLAPMAELGEEAAKKAKEEEEERASLRHDAARRRAPALSLVPLPADAILRKAPIMNAVVVVVAVAPADAAPDEVVGASVLESQLSTSLTNYLFPSGVPAAQRDDRAKALATRLYLQHQQLLRRSAAVAAATANATQAVMRSRSASAAACSSPTSASLTATVAHAVPSEWPFRHAAPLNSFTFFNSKLNPCGTGALRPPSAPRVVVALFVADTALPCAVKPMCVALGAAWHMARVAERLKEEVVEQQLGPYRAAATPLLKTYVLYRLPQAEGKPVERLWGDGVATTATAADAAPPPLQNAEVLVLCPPDSPGAVAGLQEELHRLHGLIGKDKRALKADQIKLCSVM